MAVDIANLPSTAGGSWFDAQQRLLSANVPALTEFVGWKAGVAGIGGPTTLAAGNGVDSNQEGGAFQGAATGVLVNLSTATVWQNAKTSNWGFAFRVAFPAVSGSIQSIGLLNAGGGHFVTLTLTTAKDATHWVCRIVDVGGELTPLILTTADQLYHDVALTFDTTTIKVFIDTVLVGSTADLSHLTTDAMFPGAIFSGTAFKGITKAVWGYVPV